MCASRRGGTQRNMTEDKTGPRQECRYARTGSGLIVARSVADGINTGLEGYGTTQGR